MIRFLYGDALWAEIKKQTKAATRTRVAVAYVTKPAPLALKARDVLIVDASDGAIASGQTSAGALGNLHKSGVTLFSHTGLHAKVIVADAVLFSSSANASESSETRLFEAGIETDAPNAVSSAVGMIERLARLSTRIDDTFLARIARINVQKTDKGATSKATVSQEGAHDGVTWLARIHHSLDKPDADELRRAEYGLDKAERLLSTPSSEVGQVTSRRSLLAVRPGDNLVLTYRESENSRHRLYPHANVLWVDKANKSTLIFYEIRADHAKNSISWSQYKRLATAVGLPTEISKIHTIRLPNKMSQDLRDRWPQPLRK